MFRASDLARHLLEARIRGGEGSGGFVSRAALDMRKNAGGAARTGGRKGEAAAGERRLRESRPAGCGERRLGLGRGRARMSAGAVGGFERRCVGKWVVVLGFGLGEVGVHR